MRRNSDCYSGMKFTTKAEPDIERVLLERTNFLDSLIEQPSTLHSLLEKLESSLKENVEHADAKIGGKKKQNAQAQSKKDIQAREKAKAEQQSQSIKEEEEESIHEILSRLGTVTKDFTLEKGFVIGPVINQKKDEICWAIVLVRLLQAVYNLGLPEDLQNQFSINELVDHIQPDRKKDLKLANLRLAINRLSTVGALKLPRKLGKGSEKAGSQGLRIPKPFKICKDVEALSVQTEVDRFPVGLCLEITQELENLSKEQIYRVPKKREITPQTRSHMVLIVGYGFTKDGELYFIIQNSWGVKWSLKGFARIILDHKCDIICLDE